MIVLLDRRDSGVIYSSEGGVCTHIRLLPWKWQRGTFLARTNPIKALTTESLKKTIHPLLRGGGGIYVQAHDLDNEVHSHATFNSGIPTGGGITCVL